MAQWAVKSEPARMQEAGFTAAFARKLVRAFVGPRACLDL